MFLRANAGRSYDVVWSAAGRSGYPGADGVFPCARVK